MNILENVHGSGHHEATPQLHAKLQRAQLTYFHTPCPKSQMTLVGLTCAIECGIKAMSRWCWNATVERASLTRQKDCNDFDILKGAVEGFATFSVNQIYFTARLLIHTSCLHWKTVRLQKRFMPRAFKAVVINSIWWQFICIFIGIKVHEISKPFTVRNSCLHQKVRNGELTFTWRDSGS